jgi:hypothetical protein
LLYKNNIVFNGRVRPHILNKALVTQLKNYKIKGDKIMSLNFPNWVWWILGIVVIIIVCVVLKIDLNIGSHGLHITQGLVN